MIRKMDMEFINGKMEPSTKDSFSMIWNMEKELSAILMEEKPLYNGWKALLHFVPQSRNHKETIWREAIAVGQGLKKASQEVVDSMQNWTCRINRRVKRYLIDSWQ
jgi:hypothetical protein